ncbi:MAG TPA: DUF4157 domain-containing protein [Pyrinomonadaceae bacterium]|nr:DUF4157 domain-containing protein [Pyrinomonadaceae bacterium]
MISTKTKVEPQHQAPLALVAAKQPEGAEKSSGVSQSFTSGTAASLPPNDGQSAMRTTDRVANRGGGYGAAPLAQMMAHLQRSVGNVRVSSLVGRKIQTKPSVRRVDDPSEREADHVSEAVTQQKSNPNGSVQRAATSGATAEDRDAKMELRIKSPSGGKQLPRELQKEMEGHLGADFSQVRVHESAADRADAGRLNAKAFTHGQDIWLGAGASVNDRKLMAHELTHVMQQSAAPTSQDNPAAPNLQRDLLGPTLTNRQKIDKALKSKDPGDVKDIDDISKATVDERLALLRPLAYQGWVGPRDEWKIEEIWRSFGDQAIRFVHADFLLWNQCIDVGAALEDLPVVKKLGEQFPTDVKEVVKGYLSQNRDFVAKEMSRLGIPADEKVPMADPTSEQVEEIENMQAAAAEVAKLQLAQEKARGNIFVGYDAADNEPKPIFHSDQPEESALTKTPPFVPVTFNPYKPPALNSAPPGSFLTGVPQIKTTPYQEVKTKYDAATEQITRFQALYPALYAVSREGKSASTAAFANKASPAQARQQLGSAMRKLLHDIEETQKKVNEGKPDPLDLAPIHAQLYAGMKVSSSTVDWSDTLPKWVAKKLTVDHNFERALKDMLLETAAQAAFLLAPFTGGASIFVMLAGLAVTGVKAYKSAEEYENLARASKISMVPGTELVTLGQVERAKMMMEADQVALALAALAVGMAVAGKALGAIKGPATKTTQTPVTNFTKSNGVLNNAENGVINPNKIINYALDPDHPIGGNKAKVFKSALGYDRSNSQGLVDQIRNGVKEIPATPQLADKWGTRFAVDIPVKGPSGNAVVRTGWIYDPGSDVPRLTSLRVIKK